jgi:hypothetical protein
MEQCGEVQLRECIEEMLELLHKHITEIKINSMDRWRFGMTRLLLRTRYDENMVLEIMRRLISPMVRIMAPVMLLPKDLWNVLTGSPADGEGELDHLHPSMDARLWKILNVIRRKGCCGEIRPWKCGRC